MHRSGCIQSQKPHGFRPFVTLISGFDSFISRHCWEGEGQ